MNAAWKFKTKKSCTAICITCRCATSPRAVRRKNCGGNHNHKERRTRLPSRYFTWNFFRKRFLVTSSGGNHKETDHIIGIRLRYGLSLLSVTPHFVTFYYSNRSFWMLVISCKTHQYQCLQNIILQPDFLI